MKKKGFTLIELLAVIVLLGIILVIATLSYNNYLIKSKEKSFMLAENSFHDALLDAYSYCETNYISGELCTKLKNISNKEEVVTLNELINENHIEDIKNPYNTSEFCDTGSYIKISSKTNINISGHDELTTKVCLICGDKMSEGCNQ